MRIAEKKDRAANFLVDVPIILFFTKMALLFVDLVKDPRTMDAYLEGTIYGVMIFLSVHFAYYTLLEGSIGKTFGKKVTGTRVLTKWGDKPKVGRVLFRTLIRLLIPFDGWSYLFGKELGMHDIGSQTVVVKEWHENTKTVNKETIRPKE